MPNSPYCMIYLWWKTEKRKLKLITPESEGLGAKPKMILLTDVFNYYFLYKVFLEDKDKLAVSSRD